MVYGYIRVSTDRQTTANQKFEIQNFAAKEQLKIDKWIMEKISSREELNKRKLGNLLGTLAKHDILITSELSRLGRNLLQIMSILHFCMEHNVCVWTIKDGYRLGNDIQSKVLAFAFGLSAEIERNLISQRTKEALARIKAEGRNLGRPVGSKNTILKLTQYADIISALQKKNVSMSAMARLFGCDRKTVTKFIRQDSYTTKIHISDNAQSQQDPLQDPLQISFDMNTSSKNSLKVIEDTDELFL